MLIIGSFLTSNAQGVNYYIDSLKGSDANNGTTISAPWQTITKVNTTTFKPGDSILFICGSIWSGVTLHPLGSGTAGKPIVVSKYGKGNLPQINGNTATVHLPYAVYLINQQYFTISNLDITNNFEATSTSTATKRGVYVTAKDLGIVHNITLKNLSVHEVLGSYYSDVTAGGIFCEITGSKTPTWYDSLLIDNCHVYNVDRTGISNQSSWNGPRTINSNSKWYPSTNLRVQNCEVDSSGSNSIIVRAAKAPLIQYNKVIKSSIRYSGNSIFVFECDDALIQYNEGSFNVFNPGDADASAFDGDYHCHRTIIQYNYSHDNDGGAWVIVSDPTTNGTFDDSCIIRYNISQNDNHANASKEQAVIRIDGNITNTTVYNNTIYSSTDAIALINHCGWGGSQTGVLPDNTRYFNNIFYINQSNAAFNYNSSTNNLMNHNTYYYPAPYKGNNPIDSNATTTDPMFVSPGTATVGIYSVNGYMLSKGSPCIATGLLLPKHAKYDYSGIPVPALIGQSPCRGALEYLMDWPVTFAKFYGEQSGNVNKLYWVTTEEINNAGFEVEHSTDGITFSDLSFVQTNTATGNSYGNLNYQYTDANPYKGNNYYRLKQVDKDGHSTYSAIVSINCNNYKLMSVTAYPNPMKQGSSLSLHLSGIPSGSYEISMMDMNGVKIFSSNMMYNGIDNAVVPATNTWLPKGLYIIQLANSVLNVTDKALIN